MSQKAEEPTSTKLLKAEVDRFLGSKDPEVLSISGAWGAGKTYAWNRFLKEARDQKAIALPKYAYVSLFGIQSLDELKYAIFESTVTADEIGTEPTLEALQSHTASVLQTVGRRHLGALLGYFKNLSDVVKTVSFLSVSNQIICLDDMERKGKNLRTQDVLGLVSLLRERRRCKVVLILNDNELEPDDRGQLKRYHEKVIDSSLLFAPTAQDCVDIALPDAKGSIADLAKQVVKLDISNIRVIKKIERLVQQVVPLLSQYDKAVLEQAIQTLTLFGWAHFGRTGDDEESLIEYMLGREDWLGGEDDEKLTETERKWSSTLNRYGFTSVDELDRVLLDAVRNGYVDVDQLKRRAEELDAKHKAAHSDQALNDAWALIHESFDHNEGEAIAALDQAYAESIDIVTPGNMEALVKLLKDLGRDEDAQHAINFFMESRGNEDRGFYDLDSHPFQQLTDVDLKKAFGDKLMTFKREVDPIEILERIGREQGWSNRDIATLSSLSSENYKTLFKTTRGAQMRAIVKAATLFEHLANRDNEYDAIRDNARRALEEIAAESKLNMRRVRRLVGAPPKPKEAPVKSEPAADESDE